MNEMVKTYIGDLEVIGNGMVHVNSEQELLLNIDNRLEMEFVFLSDDKDKSFKTSSKVEGEKWIWELTNYTNSLGTGLLSPIEVGTLNERKLFASFYIWTPNEKENRRIINYVIYLQK